MPAQDAIVLSGLAGHAAAVPIAETDLLATWLADKAGATVPTDGPLTAVLAEPPICAMAVSRELLAMCRGRVRPSC